MILVLMERIDAQERGLTITSWRNVYGELTIGQTLGSHNYHINEYSATSNQNCYLMHWIRKNEYTSIT